ncbi:tryptophan synthase subunit alpha [Fuchsiella alkaliacetigena]|uniref:tryptophan synthase subunit alpha n=1 Tax=Fuchsiella alkaliacetigena TaxID=957042 RepID=UPI00200AA1E0|nr:tryptophan synthase subunit alpha [Fuchsiella alkaliacetigena]MCK8825899.1 tryptophan synthase subunit alpha [Fuchsiella alkaliacetigena]
MNRIEKKFGELALEDETAFIPYITAGDPSLEATEALVEQLAESGADMIELGVPYSDPLADGPTIQQASQRALQAGTDLDGIFNLVARLREKTEIPLILMGYYNSFYKYGFEKIVAKAEEVGVDGLIIPDLPPEESEKLEELKEGKLATIFLLASTSDIERIKLVNQASRGFIYCVSLTGVTGARSELAPNLTEFLTRVRNYSELPLAVGFGISTSEQAAQVAKHAEGVVVGSAIIDRIKDNLDNREAMLAEVGKLVKELKDAIR